MTDTPTRETYVGYTQEDLRREIVVDEAMIERVARAMREAAVIADREVLDTDQTEWGWWTAIAEAGLRAAREVT